ncbi:MAG: sensor domain-containing diguanylate cyclase [Gammaproteobacteria bacterium]
MAATEELPPQNSGKLNTHFINLIDNLSGIKELASLSTAQLPRDTLIDRIMRILFEHLNAETISLYMAKKDELHCIANINWDKFIDNVNSVGTRIQTVQIGVSPVGKAAKNKCIQRVTNYALEASTADNEQGYPAGSALYAPIISTDKLTGVIEIYHPHGDHFDNWEEYAIRIYAELVGMLIDYHAMMDDMQQVLAERTEDLRHALQESEKLRKRYEEMSVIDHLTKLYNRRFFFSEVNSGLARAIRYDQPFSLLLMDLDHFKEVNDSYGHECGDEALKFIAENLSRFTREGDTLARYGGEEFIMALPNTDLDGAVQLAERIRNTIESSDFSCKGDTIDLTISVGITSIDQYHDLSEDIVNYTPQVADLIREADRALYYVKQNGRNAVQAFQHLSNYK